ncbi:MAG: hypothetical protein U0414_16085 [Polyangiaceae bacterium]
MRQPNKTDPQTKRDNVNHGDPTAANKKPQVEGEGSYEATRRYDKGVQQTIESGRVPDLAKKARRAIEGPDAAELTEAEEKGKKPVMPS